MLLRFDAEKAAQAAGVLLRDTLFHSMSRLRLLKLLYLAERRILEEKGRPLLRARAIAMDYGPLHDDVYALIKGQHIDAPRWSQHFRNDHVNVVMEHEPEVSALSPYEIRILQEVAREFEDVETFDIVAHTHTLPEYREHHVAGTSTSIPFEKIAEAVGRGKEVDAIKSELEAVDEFHDMLRMVSLK